MRSQRLQFWLVPGEHKSVQARILAYTEAEGALLTQFRHLFPSIHGNREFVEHLRNRGKFFDHEENRHEPSER